MSEYFKTINARLKDRKAVVGVVGLGYVGLPLAVTVAKKGYKTIGFDIQQTRADSINIGESYIGDVDSGDLAELVEKGLVTATTEYSRISECDVICIAVPTPLDTYQQPDDRYVRNSSRDIAEHVKKGALIILESTTYPGTTEDVVYPIFRSKGFTAGKDLFIAFSPERVDPGNNHYDTSNTPKVTGGITDKCGQLSELFYSLVLDASVFRVSSPKAAEMEKILENTFRNINIALVNEMALLCNRMDINIWEVIEAASTKPYGFMPFYPGPGIGGHCIPIDPFYLTWKAREYDYHTRLIEISSEINKYMPEFTVERVMKMLNREKKALNGARILILGVAYKPDISDLRESPALKVIEGLREEGADIYYNDPYVERFTHKDAEYVSVELDEDQLSRADLVLVVTNHSVYDPEFITDHSKLVFDTRNMTGGLDKNNVERL